MDHLDDIIHKRIYQSQNEKDSVNMQPVDFRMLIDVCDVQDGHKQVDQMDNKTNRLLYLSMALPFPLNHLLKSWSLEHIKLLRFSKKLHHLQFWNNQLTHFCIRTNFVMYTYLRQQVDRVVNFKYFAAIFVVSYLSEPWLMENIGVLIP